LLALASLRHALQDRLGIQHSLLLTPLVVVPHQGMLRLRLRRAARSKTGDRQQRNDWAHRGHSIGKSVQL